MTTILIFESNTPDMVAQGQSQALAFIRSFAVIAPTAELRVVNPYAAEVTPEVFAGVDGVVFTGSGVSWSTDDAEAAPLRAAMELTFTTGLPVWGSCNGMQLVGSVLGGSVGASPRGIEVGMALDCQLTEAGQVHPMMAGRDSGFAVPCIHRDEIQTMPEGAVLIAGNAHSPVQAIVYEHGDICFWGSQYHPEYTTTDIARHVRLSGLAPEKVGFAVDLEQAETCENAAARVGVLAQLRLDNRARELVNWMAMVAAR